MARNQRQKVSLYNSVLYRGFLAEHDSHIEPMAASPATLTPGYLPLGFLVPDFFGSAFKAFSAANG